MVRALLVFVSLCLSGSAWAQSLSPGDIAFTAFAFDDPDAFGFLTLADIPAGTTIRFTDMGWTKDGAFRQPEGDELEGVLVWTADSAVPARTEVFVTIDGAPDVTEGSISLVQGTFGFKASYGDTILAYQFSEAEPAFINGLASGFWLNDASTEFSSTRPSAIDGVAMSMSAIDNAAYDCTAPTTGTRAELLAELRDLDNWVRNTERFDVTAGCTWPPEGCGNGALDSGEACDGATLGDGTCVDEGYSTASGVQCNETCDGFDYSNCTNTCGDGEVEPGEDCDDGGESDDCDDDCTSVSCGDGTCNATAGEDASSCATDCDTTCGDGVITGSEACDGSDLDGQDCTDHGYSTPGALACSDDCASFDTSSCTATCGDGTPEPGEACDDGNTDPGDGCAGDCTVEAGWVCDDGAPSACDPDGPIDTADTGPIDRPERDCNCATGGPVPLPGLLLLAGLIGLRRRRAS